MAEPLESRVAALEKKIESIEGQPVSGSVEFRLTRQIRRLDHKIDLVSADLDELQEDYRADMLALNADMATLKADMATLKADNTKILALLARIVDKMGGT